MSPSVRFSSSVLVFFCLPFSSFTFFFYPSFFISAYLPPSPSFFSSVPIYLHPSPISTPHTPFSLVSFFVPSVFFDLPLLTLPGPCTQASCHTFIALLAVQDQTTHTHIFSLHLPPASTASTPCCTAGECPFLFALFGRLLLPGFPAHHGLACPLLGRATRQCPQVCHRISPLAIFTVQRPGKTSLCSHCPTGSPTRALASACLFRTCIC
jgi:hypothetical protein